MATLRKVARVTGLEPATSGVTGRHSNQLSYTRISLRPVGDTSIGGKAPRQEGALDSSGRHHVSSAICVLFPKISHSNVVIEIDLQVQNRFGLFHKEHGQKMKQIPKNGIFRTAKV